MRRPYGISKARAELCARFLLPPKGFPLNISDMLRIFNVCFAAALIFAQPLSYAQEKAESRGEMESRLKGNLEKNALGDVCIKTLPKQSASLSGLKGMEILLYSYIYYITPDVHYSELSKCVGDVVAKKKGDKNFLREDVVEAVSKYFASKNLKFQRVTFSFAAVKKRLDDGVPLYCWIARSKAYETTFATRAKRRSSAESVKAWAKDLEEFVDKKMLGEANAADRAIITGYNPVTQEIRLQGLPKFPDELWITEKELKQVLEGLLYSIDL